MIYPEDASVPRVFTNDDKARIQASCRKAEADESHFIEVLWLEIDALLYRLEAGEAFIKHVLICDDAWEDVDAYKAWRKAAGK